MSASQNWFPGRDFPDREEWLKRRASTPSRKARYIHRHTLRQLGDFAAPPGEPLVLGINATKRALDKIGKRSSLVKQRHAYYRRGDNE